jgi:hypothetical protein
MHVGSARNARHGRRAELFRSHHRILADTERPGFMIPRSVLSALHATLPQASTEIVDGSNLADLLRSTA